MEQVIPAISGSTTGPLGVVHLPRLWLKLLLHGKGMLPEGYRHGAGGADEMVIGGLGIDPDAFVRYVEGEQPDYLTCEAWVKANGKNVSPEAIAKVNETILHAIMPDPRRSEWQQRFGVDFGEGWRLNQLDDWAAIPAQIGALGRTGPVIPLISNATSGPLGVQHLPRLWLKLLLYAHGRLPEGYRHGQGGFDGIVIEGLGLDADAFIGFVEQQLPDYPACEAWIRAHATRCTPEAIAAINEQIMATIMPEPRRGDWNKRFGVDFGEGYRLNQLDDWAAIHEQLIGPRD
jgi:hypothetical protein